MSSFRQTGRSARSGRAQAEHDVFEGLPVRQWRLTETTVGVPADSVPQPKKNAWPELPMPKESQLLPEHSQQLLRAARAGWLYKSTSNGVEDDEKENEEEEAKESERGFTVKKWSLVPRHLEEPEREYLSKRRKGMTALLNGTNIDGIPGVGVPMRKTKVQRTDADGTVKIYEVLVPEGQTIEGELQDQEAIPENVPIVVPPAVPGTIVEGVGVVNQEGIVVAGELPAPVRRKPPPPRRKPKKGGPGRGKKKVMFDPAAENVAPGTEGPVDPAKLAVPSTGSAEPSAPSADGDTPMGEAGEEEDEEGEDGEEDDREDGELSSGAEDDGDGANESQPAAEPEKPTVAATSASPAAGSSIEPSGQTDDPVISDAPPAQPTDPERLPSALPSEADQLSSAPNPPFTSDTDVDMTSALEAPVESVTAKLGTPEAPVLEAPAPEEPRQEVESIPTADSEAPLPEKPVSPDTDQVNEAPVEFVDEAAIIAEVGPADEAAPADEVALTGSPAPSDAAAPIDQAGPTDEVAAPEAAASETAAPADESTPAESSNENQNPEGSRAQPSGGAQNALEVSNERAPEGADLFGRLEKHLAGEEQKPASAAEAPTAANADVGPPAPAEASKPTATETGGKADEPDGDGKAPEVPEPVP